MSRQQFRWIKANSDTLDDAGAKDVWNAMNIYARGNIGGSAWVSALDTVCLIRNPKDHDNMAQDAIVITVHESPVTKNPELTVEVESGEQIRVTWVSGLGIAIDELFT